MTLHLTVSLGGSGYHAASWRVSHLPAIPQAAVFQTMARTAEHGKLDAILLGLPVGSTGGPGTTNTMRLDPLPLLGSLISVTQCIGLGAVWTVDYTEPYNVARVFATLDHLSSGRTAWFVDMFATDALVARIGRPGGLDDIVAYCERAGEFIDVVRELWDSWEDEAFALNKVSGMFADPDRVHPINHSGQFFSVRGPLNVPRPPQGNPVLIQADPATAIGRRFVATTADIVLTGCESLPKTAARCRELRALAAARVGSPHPVSVLANVGVVLGETESVARRRAAELDAALPTVPAGWHFVGTPEQLVEIFAISQQQNACDGFNLLPAVLPDDLNLLVDAVIPLAQRRGLFHTEYAGRTLREHLGLARPRSRYAAHIHGV